MKKKGLSIRKKHLKLIVRGIEFFLNNTRKLSFKKYVCQKYVPDSSFVAL